MKTKLSWCDRTLIENPLFYGVCTSEKDFAHEMQRLKVPSAPPFLSTTHAHATTHFFENDGRQTAIVCLGDFKKRREIEVIGLITHEAVHIWQATKLHIGEHTPSNEFEAYSVQWITQQLLESLLRQDKRFKHWMAHIK